MATAFTDELLSNGLTQQILKLLKSIVVEMELEKLANQKGLGDARHRRQVLRTLNIVLHHILNVVRLDINFWYERFGLFFAARLA